MTTTQRLLGGLGFPEGPRWREGKLWFSDFGDALVRTVDSAGTVTEIARVPARPSGLGWLPNGELLVVAMNEHRVLRLSGGVLVEHADLSRYTTYPCNDMVVDARGNAYVGHMGFDLLARPVRRKPASLILVRPDGSTCVAAENLMFPNGPLITADGKRLIVAETFGRRLTAFDIGSDGTLSGQRVFAELPGRSPDGICGDAAGGVWVADAAGQACVRVLEGGVISDVIATGRGCYACALGGEDGHTLFMCTADGYDSAAMASHTGAIDQVRVAIPAAA